MSLEEIIQRLEYIRGLIDLLPYCENETLYSAKDFICDYISTIVRDIHKKSISDVSRIVAMRLYYINGYIEGKNFHQESQMKYENDLLDSLIIELSEIFTAENLGS